MAQKRYRSVPREAGKQTKQGRKNSTRTNRKMHATQQEYVTSYDIVQRDPTSKTLFIFTLGDAIVVFLGKAGCFDSRQIDDLQS